MKNFLYIIITISCGIIIYGFAKKAYTKLGTKKMVYTLSEKIVTVGEQSLNVPVEAKFVVKNSGVSPIEIRSVHPDCHCTTYKLSTNIINPEDSSVVSLFYDAKRPGVFQASATIELHGDSYKEELLVFRGSIKNN